MTAEERPRKVVAEMTEQEATQSLDLIQDARATSTWTDIYGIPWDQMLSGVDPGLLSVSGEPTIKIPPSIPDVE